MHLQLQNCLPCMCVYGYGCMYIHMCVFVFVGEKPFHIYSFLVSTATFLCSAVIKLCAHTSIEITFECGLIVWTMLGTPNFKCKSISQLLKTTNHGCAEFPGSNAYVACAQEAEKPFPDSLNNRLAKVNASWS